MALSELNLGEYSGNGLKKWRDDALLIMVRHFTFQIHDIKNYNSQIFLETCPCVRVLSPSLAVDMCAFMLA